MTGQARTVQPLPQVGVQLKRAMKRRKVSPQQLADDIGVSVRLVQRWRAGTVLPGAENLVKLAECLGKPVAYFFFVERQDA